MSDNQQELSASESSSKKSKISVFWWIASAVVVLIALMGSTSAQAAISKSIVFALFVGAILLVRKALNKIPAINRSTQKSVDAKARLNKYAEEGSKAFAAGISREANPYKDQGGAESAELASFWDRGFEVAQRIKLISKKK